MKSTLKQNIIQFHKTAKCFVPLEDPSLTAGEKREEKCLTKGTIVESSFRASCDWLRGSLSINALHASSSFPGSFRGVGKRAWKRGCARLCLYLHPAAQLS